MNRKKCFCFIMIFSLFVGSAVGVFVPPVKSLAKKVSAIRTTNMYCTGRYIYYTREYCEASDYGIMRFDTKTGKIKKIFGTKYKGKETFGFNHIIVKGKYIYLTWNHIYGTGAEKNYIYRIQKNGKRAKRLAVGCKPVLAGNRIYYTKCRLVDLDGVKATTEVGPASMKLDGSDKRMEKKVKFSWKKSSPAGGDKKEATTGNNYYYTKKKSGKLMRMNLKTGKTNKVYTCGKGEKIDYIMVHKNAVLLILSGKSKKWGISFIKVYVNQKGKKKKVLHKTTYCN